MRAVEVVRHYTSNRSIVQDLADSWKDLGADVAQARLNADQAFQDSLARLARAFVPALDEASLSRAERLTGFRGFTRRSPLKAMAHEESTLRKRIAAIEGDERYRRRFALVGSAGELTLKEAELAGLVKPWRADLDRFETLPHFLELVEVGYDTPGFADSWWQPAYWKHWGQGDDVCRELGMEDFGDDVLPEWRRVKGRHDEVEGQRRRVEDEIRGVHDLVRERDEAVGRLPHLAQIYLAGAQEFLKGFLAQADLPLLSEWQDDDRAIEMNLTVAIGLSSKATRLQELVEGIGAQQQGLELRVAKYRRKVTKYQRGKYAGMHFDDRVLDRGLSAKSEKYRQRIAKTRKLADRIIGFDDWADHDLASDPHAWWHDAVGKSPPESLMPKAHRWYAGSSPPARTRRSDPAQEAVAEAAGAIGSLDDVGYLS